LLNTCRLEEFLVEKFQAIGYSKDGQQDRD
jgi:hypothetical protein